MDDPFVHGIYLEDDFAFCGKDFTGAEVVWDDEVECVTCPSCIATGRVPPRLVGEAKERELALV